MSILTRAARRWSQGAIAALLLPLAIAAAPPARAETFQLEEATIAEINAAFEADALTAEQLVQLYLDRIEAYEPELNALITINPDALEQARALDAERAESGPRSVLHGIPIILKDNYDTDDLPTTAGSQLLAEAIPPDDATIVARLEEAGAIVLAKANMSEFALSYGRLGYSSLGGLTRNPYRLSRDASGSSSGTAAAIAANLAVFGTGTDTAGSIRGPANVTALVGIKPTLGLTSRDGIVPLTLSFDVAGPMARTVTDAAIALNVMAGVDPADPSTLVSEGEIPEDYTEFLDPEALDGARIGVVRDFAGGNPEVDAAFAAAIATLEELGATVVEIELPEDLRSPWGIMSPAVTAEFRGQIEAYLGTLPEPFPKTLAELIAGSEALAESETPVNPGRIEGFVGAQASPGIADTGYLTNLARDLPAVRQLLLGLMADEELDAMLYPTMACPASAVFDTEDDSYVCESDDPYKVGYLANITGFPDITVPMGFTEAGLPVGLSFFGPDFSEPALLGFAYAFEQATEVRRPPASAPPLPGESIDYES